HVLGPRMALREEVALSDLFAESHPGTEDVAADVEVASTAETIRIAISHLPRRYAEVMELRVVEDLPIEEIAARLRRPVGTIKSWLFRARTMLSRSLSPILTTNGLSL
ncbi:RNA polymerase sigma factor, partial [bacterium]